MKQIIYAAPGIVVYAATRIASYAIEPRPYLWWHALLDVFGVVVILAIYFVVNSVRIRP